MKRINLMVLNKWAAFAYAMGTWTMLGCLIHLTHPEWIVFKDALNPDEVLPDNMEKEIYQYGRWTTVVYRRKDAVSISTKVSNYFKSFRDGSKTKVDDE